MIWSYVATGLGILGLGFYVLGFVSFVLTGDFYFWTDAP